MPMADLAYEEVYRTNAKEARAVSRKISGGTRSERDTQTKDTSPPSSALNLISFTACPARIGLGRQGPEVPPPTPLADGEDVPPTPSFSTPSLSSPVYGGGKEGGGRGYNPQPGYPGHVHVQLAPPPDPQPHPAAAFPEHRPMPHGAPPKPRKLLATRLGALSPATA